MPIPNPKSYSWAQISPSSPIWQRPALSFETTWAARPKSARDIFLTCSLTFQNPFPKTKLVADAARNAWRQLHFEIPELGIRPCWEDGRVLLRWEAPKDEEVSERCWGKSLVSIGGSVEELGFDKLREMMVAEKEKVADANAFLLFQSQMDSNGSEQVCKSQLMLYADHLITDGIGIRIILGRFLALLASSLKGNSRNEIDWTRCYANLSLPWIQCVGEEPFLRGEKFESAKEWNRSILFERMKDNPGLPFRQDQQSAQLEQQTHFITVSSAKTQALLTAVKIEIGASSTITHLGHAAMILALLRASPPLKSQSILHSPCWLNGRRYLAHSEDIQNTQTYVPVCIGFAPVVFASLGNLVTTREEGDRAVREKLLLASRFVMKEYAKIREMKADVALGVVAELFEGLGEEMMRVKHHPRPSDSHSEIGKQEVPASSADPFFLSDGITEQYMSHSYPTSSPNPAFEVNNVYFAAAAEQNLIVRMSSWRGELRISGEWRSREYEREYVIGYLQDVVDILVLLVA